MRFRDHKTLTVIASVLLLGVVAWGAYRIYDPSGRDINDLSWTEQVDLASGIQVTIRRHARFQEYGVLGLGGASSGPIDEEATIAMPGQPDFVAWTAPLRPMLLDRDPEAQEWIIIGKDIGGERLWGQNGKPCPPQWAFILRDGQWYVQPVPASWLGRRPNLLVDLRVSDDAEYSPTSFAPEVVTRKRRQNADGYGFPFGLRYVGDLGAYENTCAQVTVPSFMGSFGGVRPTAGSIPRTLTNFPRLP